MKDIFFRLLVAAALTLAAFALSSSAHGQQEEYNNLPIPQRDRLDAPAYRLLPRIRLRMNLHLPEQQKGS